MRVRWCGNKLWDPSERRVEYEARVSHAFGFLEYVGSIFNVSPHAHPHRTFIDATTIWRCAQTTRLYLRLQSR